MYSKLLDDETLAAVIAAAPDAQDDIARLARKALAVLAQETKTAVKAQIVADDPVLEIGMGDLAGLVGGDPSPKRVGMAIKEMGLKARMTRTGYRVVWTPLQIDILTAALGV